MSDLSPADMYQYYLEQEEPNNYSRIPNILGHLTYDFIDAKTGKKSVKKLSVYARELYRVIKQTAGDNNLCWKTVRHLAEEAGMSVHAVCEARKELEQCFHQLEGKSLIATTKHQKTSVDEKGKSKNKTIYHRTKIVSIWGYNNAFFKIKALEKKMGRVPNTNAPNEHVSQWEHAPQRACSHTATEQDVLDKMPLSKEQQPPASADSVVPPINKKRLFPLDEKRKAYEWMIKGGCSEGIAYKMASFYTSEEIQNASKYLENQINQKKTKIKTNKWAYFQTILLQRYWEKKNAKE